MPLPETTAPKSSLDGLWVLLVEDHEKIAQSTHVPIMARTGDESTYLLGFKNMSSARTFMQTSELENAEPRMVVNANRSEYLRLAQQAGAAGVLVDYDPATQQYASASELF